MTESTKQTHGPFAEPHWLVYEYHPGCEEQNPGVTLHCVAKPTDEQLKSPGTTLLKIPVGHEVASEVSTDENKRYHLQFKLSQSEVDSVDGPPAVGFCSKVCDGQFQSSLNCPPGDVPACDASGTLVCKNP